MEPDPVSSTRDPQDYTYKEFQKQLKEMQRLMGQSYGLKSVVACWYKLKLNSDAPIRFPVRTAVLDAMAQTLQKYETSHVE